MITNRFKTDETYFFYRGRVALFALLKAMGIQKDDEVIIQAFTCMAVPNPILSLKAKPVYVDITEDNYSIDHQKLKASITSKTKAIVIQHSFGIPAKMEEVVKIAKENNLYLIEDCCHAFGSKYNNKEIGTFGHACFFSFEWGKPVVIGLGGVAIVNDEILNNKIREIYKEFIYPSKKELIILEIEYIFHWFLKRFPFLYWFIRDLYRIFSKKGFIVGTFRENEFEGELSPDYNKLMFRKHKKRLFRKIKRLPFDNKKRLDILNIIRLNLKNPRVELHKDAEKSDSVYLKIPFISENKSDLLEEARKKKIMLSDIFNSPVHPLVKDELKFLGYEINSCPKAEEISSKVVSISLEPSYSKSYIKKITNFLNQI